MGAPETARERSRSPKLRGAQGKKLVQCGSGKVNYQSDKVPTSLYASYTYPPKVGVVRDREGFDIEEYGCDPVSTEVPIFDGRQADLTLDEDAVCMVEHPLPKVDFYKMIEVTRDYYPECCELVRKATGARKVIAFDHNIRSVGRVGQEIGNKFKVQNPLNLVHGDYTEASARRRIEDMTKPPKKNDTLQELLGDKPPLDDKAEDVLKARFQFINVWRSVHPEPIERMPLGVLSPRSVPMESFIVHEVHYSDRIGENYVAAHAHDHLWWTFPKLTADEALLIKCWDSAGDLARHPPEGVDRVPATLGFHSAVEVACREDAPDRESIEVRTIAFF